jgi:hypothetical protein
MRALPALLPETDRRFVTRVAQQPYLRFDRNDYSLDPRLVGRRDEVRASQTELAAFALDTAELAGRHRRRCARHLTFTAQPTSRNSSACAVNAGAAPTSGWNAARSPATTC